MTELTIHELGYWEVKNKPTEEELKAYYAELYYQTNQGAYDSSYSKDELQYFENKNNIKYSIIKSYFDSQKIIDRNFLDLGCGEGFTLKYFNKKGWMIKGLDFSVAGCKIHNPDICQYIVQGNLYNNIDLLADNQEKFSCITLLNVLEHVIDPIALLNKLKKLLMPKGMVIIDVPNDFSRIQVELLKDKKIDRKYWIRFPDHLSYFNKASLEMLCENCQLKKYKIISDFPIDYFLANDDCNYIMDNTRGKSCHKARVWLENLQCNISIEKTIALYSSLAELGMGRQISGYFINN